MTDLYVWEYVRKDDNLFSSIANRGWLAKLLLIPRAASGDVELLSAISVLLQDDLLKISGIFCVALPEIQNTEFW